MKRLTKNILPEIAKKIFPIRVIHAYLPSGTVRCEIEKGHDPNFMVKLGIYEPRNELQIELSGIGKKRKIEPIGRAITDPKTWISFTYLAMDLKTAEEIASSILYYCRNSKFLFWEKFKQICEFKSGEQCCYHNSSIAICDPENCYFYPSGPAG